MSLYTVRFTTMKLVRRFDKRGNIESEEKLTTPICMTALPYATAMSFSVAENFTIEPYHEDSRFTSKGSGRDNSVGNGTKKRAERRFNADFDPEAVVATPKVKLTAAERAEIAAATGDMSGAINA